MAFRGCSTAPKIKSKLVSAFALVCCPWTPAPSVLTGPAAQPGGPSPTPRSPGTPPAWAWARGARLASAHLRHLSSDAPSSWKRFPPLFPELVSPSDGSCHRAGLTHVGLRSEVFTAESPDCGQRLRRTGRSPHREKRKSRRSAAGGARASASAGTHGGSFVTPPSSGLACHLLVARWLQHRLPSKQGAENWCLYLSLFSRTEQPKLFQNTLQRTFVYSWLTGLCYIALPGRREAGPARTGLSGLRRRRGGRGGGPLALGVR